MTDGVAAECTAAPRALSLGPPGVTRTPPAAADAAIPRRVSLGPLCRLTLVLGACEVSDPDCWPVTSQTNSTPLIASSAATAMIQVRPERSA
jgi:hypothetical protein